MNKHHFEISWGSLWRILAIIAFAGVVFLVKDVLIMLLLAIIISAALDGPVDNLEKKKTNFLDCIKKITNSCINIIKDNMYNGLIKKFKIFDK